MSKKILTTSLDDAQLKQLEMYTKENGLTFSSAIRIAVLQFLSRLPKNDNLETKKTD
jgi:predicted DNA-binding ribbon-helix-helix protein